MIDRSKHILGLPPEQEAIRAKCFHPTGTFNEFKKEEIEQSIPERFEKIVRLYSDRIAIKGYKEQITYDELNKAANRLAYAIRNKQLAGEEPIALFFKPSISLIVAYMAVLKAGKIALHVDPSASRDRISLLMVESCTPLIVTNSTNYSFAREWTKGSAHLLNLDELDLNLNVENVKLFVQADDSAHIAYTSGSTGKAKGAIKTHRFALHSVLDDTNTYHICADDRVAVLGAIAIGKPILNTLLNGAALYPLDRKDDSLLHLGDWLAQNHITIFVSSPSAFRSLLSDLSNREICPSLRLIRLGSEPLYRSDVEIYKRCFNSACVLVHSYGSNETNTICDYFITQDLEIIGHRVPVGYPRRDMKVSVVDQMGNEVPVNHVGEIVVKSRFLSSGYWQHNELTADRFRSPSTIPVERAYFTGDIGRLSENDCLEHLGRKDTVVKIRGVGVDVGEIEACLLNYDEIKEAVVIARETKSGETILVAYITPKSKQAPSVTNLRAVLASSLPDYMVPTSFIILDKVPLTATGKVDRRALPDRNEIRPQLDSVYLPPRTPIEIELVSIWAEILALEQIGIRDNFFDLGGHSLAATRVVSQVIKQFQLELPLQSLFAAPTVAEMAAIVIKHQGKKLGEAEMEAILTKLESLTDEEARRLLKDESDEQH